MTKLRRFCLGAALVSTAACGGTVEPARSLDGSVPPVTTPANGDGSVPTSNGDGSASTGDGAMAPVPPGPPGGPGCNLASAAFCDTFDEGPTSARGREGDLDSTKWSVAHMTPTSVSGNGGEVANPTSPAPAPACKASVPAGDLYPPNDTLICDPKGSRGSQLMTAVATQPYGANSYMIRQPFDFAGRTGKIEFDVDDGGGYELGGGFPEINVTEEPAPGTTFQDYHNDESGPTPRNAITIRFSQGGPCASTQAFIADVGVYKDYIPTFLPQSDNVSCANISPGAMNHWEIQLSQTQLEVYGTDESTDDGQTFPNFRKIFSAPISLSFSRGYVHVQARNHNTRKYGFGPDAVFHWDNIGFDGPVLPTPLSYEIPDNATMGTYDGPGSGVPTFTAAIMNLGYQLQDGTAQKAAGMYDPVKQLPALQFKNVDPTGITSATLTFNGFFLTPGSNPSSATTSWGWQYRFNGGTWRTRTLTPLEVTVINNMTIQDGGSGGNISMVVDVQTGDLTKGTNTFEILPIDAPMNYPPVISNIDLTLSK